MALTIPLASSTFLSLPSAKKPTAWLLGDQNGKVAPSVPASDCAATESSGLTQSVTLPSRRAAVNARRLPSGERTAGPASSPWQR